MGAVALGVLAGCGAGMTSQLAQDPPSQNCSCAICSLFAAGRHGGAGLSHPSGPHRQGGLRPPSPLSPFSLLPGPHSPAHPPAFAGDTIPAASRAPRLRCQPGLLQTLLSSRLLAGAAVPRALRLVIPARKQPWALPLCCSGLSLTSCPSPSPLPLSAGVLQAVRELPAGLEGMGPEGEHEPVSHPPAGFRVAAAHLIWETAVELAGTACRAPCGEPEAERVAAKGPQACW